MRKFLAAGVIAATLFSAPALSDNTHAIPAPAGMNWTGMYVGLNAGWIDRKTDWVYPSNGDLANQRGDAGFWGGQVGIQQQFGAWVLGIEGALGAIDKWSSTACPNTNFNCESRLTSFWTIGPRVGYAFNNWLLFVNGGYAKGQMNTRAVLVSNGAQLELTGEDHDGWYLGGGVDFAVSQNLILGIEYQHIDLGSELHCTTGCTTASRRVDATDRKSVV